MKVLVVVGTRPEIIRLACVLKLLSETTELVLVHTGQNYDYELNEIFFEELGLKKPDYFLNAAHSDASASVVVGVSLQKIDAILADEKPDAFLVLGDTNSALCAYAAKRRKIAVFHMEAGNRCFDERVPEEINRKIIDHLADVNLPYSQIARTHLLAEGLRPDRIVVTGSPMKEVIQHYLPMAQKQKPLEKAGVKAGRFILASLHREENVDYPQRFSRLLGALEKLSEQMQVPVLLSTHPRTLKRIEAAGKKLSQNILTHKPFGFLDYLHLQTAAKLVVSDSGTVFEEADILGTPALCLRETHERPEAMEESVAIVTGSNEAHILNAAKIALTLHARGLAKNRVRDYQATDVAQKVLTAILSYTDRIRYTNGAVEQTGNLP